jgi:hypothetical protein
LALLEQLPESIYRGRKIRSQGVIQWHDFTLAGLQVEQRTFWDPYAKHLLKANRLSAELNAIAIIHLGPAPLVFHGIGLPTPVRLEMKFDEIRDSRQAIAVRAQLESSDQTRIAPALGAGVMHSIVESLSFCGQSVVLPKAFDVDQGALTWAKDKMLERGKRKISILAAMKRAFCHAGLLRNLVFGQTISISSTPVGRSGRSMEIL